MTRGRRRLVQPHGVQVVQVPVDEELGLVLVEDEPVRDDHVLEQRTTQHGRLDRLPVASQLADRIEVSWARAAVPATICSIWVSIINSRPGK